MRLPRTVEQRKAFRSFYKDRKLDAQLVSYLYDSPSEDFAEYQIGEILIPERHAESFREISEQVRASGVELLYRPSESVGYLAIHNLQIVGRVWPLLWYLNQLVELERELS